MGDGVAPEISDQMRVDVAKKYIEAYTLITGDEFEPSDLTPEAERKKIVKYIENL